MSRESDRLILVTRATVAAGLAACSLATGQEPLVALATAAGSLGINLVSSLVDQGFELWRTRWLSHDGILGDDIGWALGEALRQVVVGWEVTRDWGRHPHYRHLLRTNPQEAQRTLDAVRDLQRHLADFFRSNERVTALLGQEEIEALLHQDRKTADRILDTSLREYVYGDSELADFVGEQLTALIDQWLLHFGSVLKDSGEQSTRAWRAYQWLWQESLTAAVQKLQEETSETRALAAWLKDWAERLETLPPTRRETTGQEALEQALDGVQRRLEAIKADTQQIKEDTGYIRESIDELLNRRVSPLPSEAIVQGMIEEYEEIFGGRRTELAALDAFLGQSEQLYALILAPTGLGKTALLIHWVVRVQAAGRWTVVFVPISRRFGTASEQAVLGRLALALAAFHGQTLQGYDLSPEQLRGSIADFLRREPPSWRRLLVVLDGLDEAVAGPSLLRGRFPRTPGPHLRVVASARDVADKTRADWLAELGWEVNQTQNIPLGKLVREDVAEILQQARGLPCPPETDVDLVTQVYRVSKGDPLTSPSVGIVAEQLAASMIGRASRTMSAGDTAKRGNLAIARQVPRYWPARSTRPSGGGSSGSSCNRRS